MKVYSIYLNGTLVENMDGVAVEYDFDVKKVEDIAKDFLRKHDYTIMDIKRDNKRDCITIKGRKNRKICEVEIQGYNDSDYRNVSHSEWEVYGWEGDCEEIDE